jgi:hypothetical protein
MTIGDRIRTRRKELKITQMDTTGTYGHKKAGDLDKAAGYIDEAFSKYVSIS